MTQLGFLSVSRDKKYALGVIQGMSHKTIVFLMVQILYGPNCECIIFEIYIVETRRIGTNSNKIELW